MNSKQQSVRLVREALSRLPERIRAPIESQVLLSLANEEDMRIAKEFMRLNNVGLYNALALMAAIGWYIIEHERGE